MSSPLKSSSTSGNPQSHLLFLDGLRGLAAVYVMLFHARWLLWEGYTAGFLSHPNLYPLWAKGAVYTILLFSFGHQMVFLFFVLSGFVIHLKYARQIQLSPDTPFEWRPYAFRRIKRLYPPLIFTMFLTFGLDQLGKQLGFPVYFEPTILNLDIKPIHDGITALGNLIFVMGIYGLPWGMNGALWSLAYEAWFYVLYPIFQKISKHSILIATSVIVILFGMSFVPGLLVIKLFQSVFSLMLAWWFGVLLADIYAGRLKIKLWKLTPLSLLIVVLAPVTFLYPAPSTAISVIEDTLWALGFSGILAGLMALQNRNPVGLARLPIWTLEQLKPIGDFSYTLYVIHFPILIFISGWLISHSPTHSLPIELRWIFVGCTVCLLTAYAAHFITEKPFTRHQANRNISVPIP